MKTKQRRGFSGTLLNICIVTLIAFGLMLMVGFLECSKVEEPTYDGKSLSKWADDINFPERGGPDRRTPEERIKHDRAVEAIRHIGTNALPFALAWCEENAPEPSFELSRKWSLGVNVFHALGPNAAPAIPALIDLLRRGEVSGGNAEPALYYVGPQTISQLLSVLTNGSSAAEERAAFVLGRFGHRSEEAIPALLGYACESHGELRNASVEALLKITQDPKVLVPILTRFVEADNGNFIPADFYVYRTLASLGTNALKFVPILKSKIQAGQDPQLAMESLYCIDPNLGRAEIKKYAKTHTNFDAAAFINLMPSGGKRTF